MKRTYVVLLLACSALYAAVPKGWHLAGSAPASYDCGIDAQAMLNGLSSAYLKSTQPVPTGFGTLMQNFAATQYIGQRVRFSAMVKSANLEKTAGLWMRVDGEIKNSTPTTLAFDNMVGNRPIKGTTDWQRYNVVLDVPQGATGIFFGIMVSGTGEVWLSDVSFTPVGTDVATTGQPMQPPNAPTNLGFEESR